MFRTNESHRQPHLFSDLDSLPKKQRRRLTPLATEETGWVEVGHDDTDDFDSLTDLQRWRRKHAADLAR